MRLLAVEDEPKLAEYLRRGLTLLLRRQGQMLSRTVIAEQVWDMHETTRRPTSSASSTASLASIARATRRGAAGHRTRALHRARDRADARRRALRLLVERADRDRLHVRQRHGSVRGTSQPRNGQCRVVELKSDR